MGLAVMAYLPVQLVHRTPYAAAAAANGQCLAFRRAAYAAVGGHAAVAHDVIEDVTLAKRIKRAGLHLRMADGAGLVRCRMYDGWPAVRDGYAKNILAGHGNSIPLLLLSVFFHLAVFVWPWLWLVLRRPAWGWPFWPLLLVTLGVGVRATTARATTILVDSVELTARPFSPSTERVCLEGSYGGGQVTRASLDLAFRDVPGGAPPLTDGPPPRRGLRREGSRCRPRPRLRHATI